MFSPGAFEEDDDGPAEPSERREWDDGARRAEASHEWGNPNSGTASQEDAAAAAAPPPAKKKKRNWRKPCSVEGCTNLGVKAGVCIRHGAKLPKRIYKPCTFDGCPSHARNHGVCFKHGATRSASTALCRREGCPTPARHRGLCQRHGTEKGVPPRQTTCKARGCTKWALRGGVCVRHGAVPLRCSAEGCENKAVKGGVCMRHGAKQTLCKREGCTKYAQIGGVCRRHGAVLKLCEVDGCGNVALKAGVCQRHGAKPPKCKFELCTVEAHGKDGMCKVCKKYGEGPKLCSHAGCTVRAPRRSDFCYTHDASKPDRYTCSHEGCANIAMKEKDTCAKHSVGPQGPKQDEGPKGTFDKHTNDGREDGGGGKGSSPSVQAQENVDESSKAGRWRCDVCLVATFDTYAEAVDHEAACQGGKIQDASGGDVGMCHQEGCEYAACKPSVFCVLHHVERNDGTEAETQTLPPADEGKRLGQTKAGLSAPGVNIDDDGTNQHESHQKENDDDDGQHDTVGNEAGGVSEEEDLVEVDDGQHEGVQKEAVSANRVSENGGAGKLPGTAPWQCHICDHPNAHTRRRCVKCQGWKDGRRKEHSQSPQRKRKRREKPRTCVRKGCKNVVHLIGGVCARHKICSREGCTRPALCGDVCSDHKESATVCCRIGCANQVCALGREARLCYKHHRSSLKRCNHAECDKVACRGEDTCGVHRPRKQRKLCSHDGCNTVPRNGDVCALHLRQTPSNHDDSQKPSDKGERGSNRRGAKRKLCEHLDCEKVAQKGGKCFEHSGAKRKLCGHLNCGKVAQKGGKCLEHSGAKRKLCEHPNCPNPAKSGGMCSKHSGAQRKRCEHPGCEKQAQRGGACLAHDGTIKRRRTESPPRPKQSSREPAKKKTRRLNGRRRAQLKNREAYLADLVKRNIERNGGKGGSSHEGPARSARGPHDEEITTLVAHKPPNAKAVIVLREQSAQPPGAVVIHAVLPESIFAGHRLGDGEGAPALVGAKVVAVNGILVRGPCHAAELISRASGEVRLAVKP